MARPSSVKISSDVNIAPVFIKTSYIPAVQNQIRRILDPEILKAEIANLASIYRTANVTLFKEKGLELASRLDTFGEDSLKANVSALAFGMEIAKRALPQAQADAVVRLAQYLVNQSQLNDYPENLLGPGFGKAPRSIDERRYYGQSGLVFDQGFIDLLDELKPQFCQALVMHGFYKSESGHPTKVTVMTDADRDMKVLSVERVYSSSSADQIENLIKDLSSRYAPFIDSEARYALYTGNAWRDAKADKFFLLFKAFHPAEIGVFSSTNNFYRELWGEGWKDFRQDQPGSVTIGSALTDIFKKTKGCKDQIPNMSIN